MTLSILSIISKSNRFYSSSMNDDILSKSNTSLSVNLLSGFPLSTILKSSVPRLIMSENKFVDLVVMLCIDVINYVVMVFSKFPSFSDNFSPFSSN